MTELREELKVGSDEGPVEYADRAEAVLERHRRETGERLSTWSTMPGEGPGEVLERIKVIKEAGAIRGAERTRRRERADKTDANQEGKGGMTATEESTRRFRVRSQERDVEKAVSEFEAKKKRLYRSDGSQVYAGEEHAERLEKLTAELREQVEDIVREAEEDAAGYERETLALSYIDPAEAVSASERDRLQTSRAFVKEDCEGMSLPALTARISAVSAGSDKVAQVLHARYGRRRLEALGAELSRQAAEGRAGGAEVAAERRGLEESITRLEEQLKDPKRGDREKVLKEAQAESRRAAQVARRRLSEADGTDERVRREYSEHMRATF